MNGNIVAYMVAGSVASFIGRIVAKLAWFYIKPRLKQKEFDKQGFGW